MITDDIARIMESRPEIVELMTEAAQVLKQPDGAKKVRLAVLFLELTRS